VDKCVGWVCVRVRERVFGFSVRESGWISMLGVCVCVCERECSGSLSHSRSNTCDMTHSCV